MYIYKTTNLINNKIYIGLSTKSVEESTDYYGSGKLIKEAIQKYGKENFTKEIIENHIENFDNLKAREIYWIEYFKSYASYDNYNLTLGGEGTLGRKFSDDSIKKISKNHADVSGSNNPMYGKHHNHETKAKISKVHKGKVLTEEHKLKIAEASRNISDETRTKMSDTRLNYKQNQIECPHCKKVGGNSLMTRYHFDNCKILCQTFLEVET